jgi:hypothetical protein
MKVCLVSALVLLLGTAGCGGSGDKEAWAKEANALCRDLERDVRGVAPLREIEHPEEFAPYVSSVAAVARDWLARMRELEAPEDEEERVDEMLDLYEAAIDKTDDAATTLGDGDEAGYERLLREADGLSGRADVLARDLDVEACTHPLSG